MKTDDLLWQLYRDGLSAQEISKALNLAKAPRPCASTRRWSADLVRIVMLTGFGVNIDHERKMARWRLSIEKSHARNFPAPSGPQYGAE